MWRYQPSSTDGGDVTLELTRSAARTGEPSPKQHQQQQAHHLPLTIDVEETLEEKIQRLISENPVIIFTLSSCYMCHVMKKLFTTLTVHPAVIELDDHEMAALKAHDSSQPTQEEAATTTARAPVVFIGGTHVGGLESLVALHVTGNLVPKLGEAGALWRSS